MTLIRTCRVLPVLALLSLASAGGALHAAATPCDSRHSDPDDATTVAALDTQYQAAVKANDDGAMDRILADDFTLVVGSGKSFTKADLLNEARSGSIHYEHQEDTDRRVQVWGGTAVVTAKLHESGIADGKPFDKTLWFSDTYIRTASGWKYVFGQASLALP